MKLKKVLNIYDLIFAGYGFIIGAGVYTLLGFTYKYSKNNMWISFVLGGLVSLLSGYSYANLSKNYKDSSAEYDYVSKNISKEAGILVAFFLATTSIFSIATLCNVFSQYLGKYVSVNPILSKILITIIYALVNIISVKGSSNLNIVMSLAETSILLILILVSYKNWNITVSNNIKGTAQGAFFTIFAYLGFESIVKLSEDTENPERDIPKAIFISIIAATLVYIGVSLSVSSILKSSLLTSISPISDSFKVLYDEKFTKMIDSVAIMSISSSILLTIMSNSRLIYGVSKKNIFPKFFSKINEKTNTPINAIIFTSVIPLILSFLINTENLTIITNIFIFVVFSLVNLSSYMMDLRMNNKQNIVSLFGFISTIIMVLFSSLK
jgi:basic amino acid/polyamine antiporter, APA family